MAARRPLLARLSMRMSLLAGLLPLLLSGPARAQQKAPAAAMPVRSSQKPPALLAGVGLLAGGSLRLDDSQSLETTQRTGIVVGGHLALSPSRWFSVGAAYEHSELSREQTSFLPAGDASVVRRLDTLWANLRVYVLERDGVAPFVDIAPGIAWQSVQASGIGFLGVTTNDAIAFRCKGGAGANLGLRAGLGIEAAATNGLVLSGQMTFDNLRLSSDVLDGCAPGAGSAAVMGLRVGLAYRFDVTPLFR
jgi:opacity protein-like surface antigen